MYDVTQGVSEYPLSEPRGAAAAQQPAITRYDPSPGIVPFGPVRQHGRAALPRLESARPAQRRTPAGERCETLLFVDCGLRHPRLMIEGLDPHAAVYRLSPGGNPLAEIASIVSSAAPVGRIAILTQAAPGTSTLSQPRTGCSLRDIQAAALAQIRAALAPGADILLMLCGVATYRSTQTFIAGLEAGLGVPVHSTETDLCMEAGQSSFHPVATIFAPSAYASYSERFAVSAAGDGGEGA